jgi:hypothetical protein
VTVTVQSVFTYNTEGDRYMYFAVTVVDPRSFSSEANQLR